MSLTCNFYDGGYCTHLERMVMKGTRFCESKFPSIFAHIHHPLHGHILYDTGYSNRFFEETTQFPYSLYAKLTKVFLEKKDTAIEKLKQQGVAATDVRYIIISHFHADHIAALKDFPKAKFIYMKKGYDKLKKIKSSFAMTINGFLPGLLPADFEERSIYIENLPKTKLYNKTISDLFQESHDIFGDGSMIGIELAGHARGQLGLYFEYDNNKTFLIADSCWLSQSYKSLMLPATISFLIADKRSQYIETLKKLNKIFLNETEVALIPSHCGRKYLQYVKEPTITHNLSGCHSG